MGEIIYGRFPSVLKDENIIDIVYPIFSPRKEPKVGIHIRPNRIVIDFRQGLSPRHKLEFGGGVTLTVAKDVFASQRVGELASRYPEYIQKGLANLYTKVEISRLVGIPFSEEQIELINETTRILTDEYLLKKDKKSQPQLKPVRAFS